MASPSVPIQDQDKSIDTVQLDILLEKIHSPPDRIGLSYAINELLDSAKAILRLAPESHTLSELASFLEKDKSNLDLPIHLADRDLNPMYGRYEEYPLYSLFTQRKKMEEDTEFTARFHLVTGLLLASIWLSDTRWNPVENGYAEFVADLRRTRKIKNKEGKLRAIDLQAESLQELINRLFSQSNPFISKICSLAIRVNKGLVKTDFQQQAAFNNEDELPPEQKPEIPPKTEPAQPKSPEQKQTQPKQREPDLGDSDEWKIGKKKHARPVVTRRPPALVTEQIVLRNPTAHRRGVDTSETDVTSTIAQAAAVPKGEELPSLSLQKWQVLDARFATEFDNQFLPYTWEVLNEHDVTSIVDQIKSILSNKSEAAQTRIGALVAGLLIMTSRSPKELAEFRLCHTKTPDKLASPAILIGNACWYSPFPPLERFEPNDEQAQWLKPVGDGCYLPLPTELLFALCELSTNGETLGIALGCSAEEIDNLAQDFCKAVRRDAKSRANVSWLRSIMFHKLLALSGDDVGSIATLGNTEHAPNVGLYYATFEQSKWRGIYSRAITALAFTLSIVDGTDSLPYGSRQYPDEIKLREWIISFFHLTLSHCKKAKSTAEMTDAHNHFAFYTFLMLLACTGHRPADQYTFSILALDLENGWIIISDKITSPSTRVRLIPLPPLVIKQLKNYLVHLRNFSKRIQAENPELADKISMLIEEPIHELFSLFFWLDEKLATFDIDIPSSKEKYNWPFEGNVFRHCLATGLRNKDALAEYIAILLGHVGIGQFGFGKFSTLSPSTWKENIIPALNLLLESQGWANIAGITHTRWSSTVHESKREVLEEIPAIDFFTKARTHVEDTKSDREIVRKAFFEAKKNTPPDRPKEEFLTAFENEIINRSLDTPDRLAKRLNVHMRFIRLHRHALNPSSIPGWATDMHNEDSPFEPESLALANCASHFRDAIPSISQDSLAENYHENIALIQISSVLFGGLLRKTLVQQIPAKLSGGVRWFEEYLWIDFDDPQSGGGQRWFPDPVTALLIARFIIKAEASPVANNKHLRQSMTKLLNKMGQGRQSDFKVNSLDDLFKISKAYFALNLPGLLRAFSGGDIRSASLTEGCLLRLLSGRPLVGQQVEGSGESIERGSIQPLRHTNQDVRSARVELKEIFDAIRDAFPASSSGATNLKGARKNPLTKLSKSLYQIAASSPDMPSIVIAILSWTNHLATEGSVVVRNPAIGTIYSYVTDISRPLIEFCSDVDFIELTEAELTDIYQRVIDAGSKKTRSSRAKSLRWFHDYCEEEFDIPEVDWDDVAPGLTNDSSKVSANMVTYSEYCIAKSLIKNHPQLNIRDRQMHLVALILIYRCGLRLGELLRITVSDVVLQGRSVILVRNGIYGKTKTRAGIRQIPWLDKLDDEEKIVVKDWIEHRKVAADGDPWAALFGISEESRTLEVRLHLSRVLMEVLRFVTGDPTIKIHHLRHGAGTSALAIALSIGCPGNVADSASGWFGCRNIHDIASNFREFHLGQSGATRRIVYAISQALGHTSPRTTCWHYGHLLDYSLLEHVSSLISLKNIEVANLSGMSQNAIAAAVFKNPGKTPAKLALKWLLKDVHGLEPHTQLADQPVNPGILPSKAPIQPLISPKLAHIILTDLASGFSVEKIAGRHAREEIEIQTIEAAARKIEKVTGYQNYRLVKAANEIGDNNLLVNRKKKLKKLLSGHGIELIEKFQEALKNPKIVAKLQDGVDVWLESYQRSHRGLRIFDADEQNKIIELMRLLGFKNEQIALAGNSLDLLNEELETSDLKIPSENLIQRANSYRSIKRTSLEKTYTPTLLVSITSKKLKDSARTSQGGASLAMKKLHHLFFLTAVIQRCRSEWGNNQST